MVRATVFLLLALVGSVMLTQTVATRNVYNDLSAVPTCQADYAKMDPEFPKLLLNEPFLYYSAGVCTNPKNGDSVIGYWQPRPYVFLHDIIVAGSRRRWIYRQEHLTVPVVPSVDLKFSMLQHKAENSCSLTKKASLRRSLLLGIIFCV